MLTDITHSDEVARLPAKLPEELRESYLSSEVRRANRPVRAAILLASALMALFGIRDWVVAPELAHLTASLRALIIGVGLVAAGFGRSPRRLRLLATGFVYALLLGEMMIISLLPLGFRYQLNSILIIPLGASLFMPEVASLYRMQAVALVAAQLGLWYQAPPALDVVAAESALGLTSLVAILLGTMGIRSRQRQFMLEHHLRNEARRDALTGLYNRRHLETVAKEEVRRAVRFRRALSVIAIDIDHFKVVNDAHGHHVGDLVLVATAESLLRAVRECDLLARTGGEEFVLLLPETALVGAAALAERLRRELAEVRSVVGKAPVQWTISCGVAELTAEDATFEAVLRRADDCLYQAKELGRDRVSTSPIARCATPPS